MFLDDGIQLEGVGILGNGFLVGGGDLGVGPRARDLLIAEQLLIRSCHEVVVRNAASRQLGICAGVEVVGYFHV